MNEINSRQKKKTSIKRKDLHHQHHHYRNAQIGPIASTIVCCCRRCDDGVVVVIAFAPGPHETVDGGGHGTGHLNPRRRRRRRRSWQHWWRGRNYVRTRVTAYDCRRLERCGRRRRGRSIRVLVLLAQVLDIFADAFGVTQSRPEYANNRRSGHSYGQHRWGRRWRRRCR